MTVAIGRQYRLPNGQSEDKAISHIANKRKKRNKKHNKQTQTTTQNKTESQNTSKKRVHNPNIKQKCTRVHTI